MIRATEKPYDNMSPRCVLWENMSDDGGRTLARPFLAPLWGFPRQLLLLSDGRVFCAH